MSRPINITSAVTFIPTSYNTSLSNGITTVNSYPPSNGLNGSGNTTNYAVLSGTSVNVSGYAYYDFTVTGIPSNATITSVECVARARTSNGSRGRCAFQLCNGTTQKGSATTFTSTTTTAYVLTAGTWTVSELSNIKLRITVVRTNSNYTYSARFYGSTLLVEYSVNGTLYETTATSTYTGATVNPSSQETFNGDSAVVKIYTDDVNNITVEDNGNDVTDQLQYVVPTGGSFTFTGVPSSYDSVNSSVAGINPSYPESNGLTDADSTTRATFSSFTQTYSETNIYYNFDCSSIPENAIITSVSCEFKSTISSNYFPTRISQLCHGTTKKGSPTTVTNSSATSSTPVKQTMNDCGTWTREELEDIKILTQGIRTTSTNAFGISFFGAKLTINYTVPDDPYYSYTINNINTDHDVVVSESIYIPPEEDPDKIYHSVTISSINASTEPGRGTTRVESGTNETITITPSDPKLTLALDNGVDISSQLVQHGGIIPDPTVTTAPGASYSFVYNSSTGYYTSNNKGVDKSAAVCVVNFDLPVRCLVTIEFINYAEATYDFGVFGNIDTTLSNNYYSAGSGGATITDTNYKLACNTSTYNTATPHTITYEIPSGEHSIYIKYSKDDATGTNNDTLQFRVTDIEALEPNNYYTYTLSNIDEDHSLIFIFGDVTYYFVTSNGTNAKLNPDGQMVQLPGDTYKLTIVPNNIDDIVTITDNNVDVTNSLVKKEEIIEKEGQQITIVNYIYTLNNIQATHTLTVLSTSRETLFRKVNSNWGRITKAYKKINNNWQEVTVFDDLFDDETIYINKS